MLITSSHDYDHGVELPYDDTSLITKDIIIKENVWVGQKVIILPGVIIDEGAIIQSGSVVVKNVPALSIVGGNPAKVFKERNKEHYWNLKKKESIIKGEVK